MQELQEQMGGWEAYREWYSHQLTVKFLSYLNNRKTDSIYLCSKSQNWEEFLRVQGRIDELKELINILTEKEE